MGTIIASLALFVALVALWLASANIKKIELGQRELKSQLTSDIAKTKREVEKKIDTVNKRVDALDGKVSALIEANTQNRETISVLQKEVAKVSEEFNDLVLSLPPQLRQPKAQVRSEFG